MAEPYVAFWHFPGHPRVVRVLFDEMVERMARVLHVRCLSSSDLGSREHYDRDTAWAELLLAAAVGEGEVDG